MGDSDRHRFMQSADRAHMVGISSYCKVVMEISKAWRDLIQLNKLVKLGLIHRNDRWSSELFQTCVNNVAYYGLWRNSALGHILPSFFSLLFRKILSICRLKIHTYIFH